MKLLIIKNKFPELYTYFKNNAFFKNSYLWFKILFKIIKKEKNLIRFYIVTTFSYYILNNKKDITFPFHGFNITMPRHLKGIEGFIEVWSDKFYDKIKGYDNVLDLGGFIGDSALFFSKSNKNITVYEASPGNFNYLKKNTENISNINIYHYAVVGGNNKFIEFSGGDFNEGASISNEGDYIAVPCKNIIDILQDSYFDCLKMDIEGSEYECFDAIIKNSNNFNFKSGFIEFHFWDKKQKQITKTNDIIKWLNLKYNTKIYSVIPEHKEIDKIENLEVGVCLVYFQEKS